MNEAEALQSGLLEPYSDGKFHLDWPMSRGMAARILARVWLRAGFRTTLPQAFPDVASGAAAAPALTLVGQAFRASADRRFHAEQIFTPADLRFALEVLGRSSVASEPAPVAAADTASETELEALKAEIRPALGFPQRDALLASSSLRGTMASDVLRLGRLVPLVPSEQLGPQAGFDLEGVTEGVAEMEAALDSFELTIYDVTLADPQDEGLKNEVREFLAEMRPTLRNVGDKLRMSRLELKHALLVDPESIRRSAELGSRIDTAMFRLDRLSERVEERLGTISPKGTTR